MTQIYTLFYIFGMKKYIGTSYKWFKLQLFVTEYNPHVWGGVYASWKALPSY